MGAPNNNYVSSVRNFSAGAYYVADNISRFNPGDVDHAWSCVFWIDGTYHSTAARNCPEQFLWGNELVNTGWSLRLVNGTSLGLGGTADEAFIAAVFGTGAAQRVAAARLSVPAATPTVAHAAGFYRRLIMATAWYRSADQSLWLAVNGSPVAYDDTGGAAPAASSAAPRMGLSPAGSDAASYCSIVGCAFDRGVQLGQSFGVGLNAAESWAAARGSFSQDVLSPTGGYDWTYRWNVQQSVGNVQGTILKSADGVAVQVPPLAPATLEDFGSEGLMNRSLQSTPLYIPVSPLPSKIGLTQVGNTLVLGSDKNPIWYAGTAATQIVTA